LISKYVIPAIFGLTMTASATELHSIEVRTGTNGLDLLPLTVDNRAPEPIRCSAEIAHWYSLELVLAQAGESVEIELWFDPASGTYTTLNEKDENLPIERLWCGFAGRAYETRSQILLDRSGASPAPQRVACANSAGRLDCR
jgi:hypothetical protein